MYLKKIALLNFKNIAREELSFCPGINALVGDNGAGKTNILDAVYYLSMCKSALQMTDGQSIRHGEEFFLLEGRYATDAGRRETIVCSFSRRSGKLLKRNGKEYDRLSDHVGLIPAVIVSPADSALISDAADERRRYLNAFISQLDRPYLQAVMRYNAVLAERNRLLKMHPDETMLAIYDMQFCEHGRLIHARRRDFVERLQPVVERYYRMLAEDREQVELSYRSELNDRPFEEVLRDARQKDLVNEFTTAGIHRDDLVLKIGGYPLRKYGSQGQQKSFLIALKLAQYAIVAEERHERPILLLDDLFDKLDAGRVEQLIRLVSEATFGQIFISDCNPTRLKAILDRSGGDYSLFTVTDGSVTQERQAAEGFDETDETDETSVAGETGDIDEPGETGDTNKTDQASEMGDTYATGEASVAGKTGNTDEPGEADESTATPPAAKTDSES